MELCNAITPSSQIDWAPWIPTLVPGGLTAMRTSVVRAAVDSLMSGALRCVNAPMGVEGSATVADDATRLDKPVNGIPTALTQTSNRQMGPAGTDTPSPEQCRKRADMPDGKEPRAQRVLPMIGGARRAVSRHEAGAMLGVSWKTIERLINRGELKAFKVLGQWRIMVSEIDAYIERQAAEQKKRIGA